MLIPSSAIIAVTLAAAAPAAVAQAPRQDQAQQNRFCVMVGTEGQARCAYRSLAQCERATRRGGRCFDRTYMLAMTTPRDAAATERPVPHRRAVKHHKPMR
jgi:hypothetical protein